MANRNNTARQFLRQLALGQLAFWTIAVTVISTTVGA